MRVTCVLSCVVRVQLWSAPTTASDVWSCLSDELLTSIRDHQPANFASLLHRVTSQLVDIVYASKSDLASVKPLRSVTNSYTASQFGGAVPQRGAEDPVVSGAHVALLNCVRILTRCMSMLTQHPENEWLQSYMWGGELPAALSAAPASASAPAPAARVSALIARGTFGDRSLGSTILLALLDLLFLEGFCVHPSLATSVPDRAALRHTGVQLDKLWEVSTATDGTTIVGPPNMPNVRHMMQQSQGWSSYDSHRTEVLRCLLVLFSDRIFLPPPNSGDASGTHSPSAPRGSNRFVAEFVSESSACARWTPTLCWSLLNLILGYRPEGNAAVTLPYNYTLFEDHREPLVETSLHFLLVLLDERPSCIPRQSGSTPATPNSATSSPISPTTPSAAHESILQAMVARLDVITESKDGEEQPESSPSSVARTPAAAAPLASPAMSGTPTYAHTLSPRRSDDAQSHVFHSILAELINGPCLTSIYANLCRLLLSVLHSESTLLPGSLKRLEAAQEVLLLTWRLVDINPAFMAHVLHASYITPLQSHASDILSLVTPLLYFVHQSRKDETQIGTLYTCIFMLLRLSGDREFCVALNRPVGSVSTLAHVQLFTLLGLPTIAGGTYADVLVIVVHQLIISSPNQLDSMLRVVLTLLANVSPYLTKLSLFASTQLLHLFELFSASSFLRANESNHQYAAILIDAINNIIQYQYQGHAPVVYSLLRHSKQFIEIGRLEVEEASTPTTSPTAAAEAAQQGDRAAQPTRTIETSAPTSSSSPFSAPSSPSPTSRMHPFVPTAAWANSWKRALPLEPIYRLIDFFSPKVEIMIRQESHTHMLARHTYARAEPNAIPVSHLPSLLHFLSSPSPVLSEAALLTLIGSTTLVGVLPVPHPLVVRQYIPNAFTDDWFSTFQFGLIFLRQQARTGATAANAPLWNERAVKRFVIAPQKGSNEHAQAQSQQRPQPQSTAATPRSEQDQPAPSAAPSARTTADTGSDAPPHVDDAATASTTAASSASDSSSVDRESLAPITDATTPAGGVAAPESASSISSAAHDGTADHDREPYASGEVATADEPLPVPTDDRSETAVAAGKPEPTGTAAAESGP